MEGFDIRTLALTNLFLSVLLGLGSIVFSRIDTSFRSFRQLGSGYFLFALGFVLIGLRAYVSDFFSIIIANALIVAGFSILIMGILKFLDYPTQHCKNVTLTLIFLLISSFLYFTYINNNASLRIIIISAVIAAQCFFSSYKIMRHKEKLYRLFTRFLGYAFLFCGLVFSLRVYITATSPLVNNFMEAGSIHAMSLVAQQLVVITSCFTLSWSASQKLVHKLAIQATIDPLTQVYNRRAMEEFAEKEILRAQRNKSHLAIILMDIDLFKQVNDNYGHQVGDKVLQEFALRLKNSLRQYDTLARYGGEEFLLLLPNTEAEIAITIAEKLRNTIAQPVFELNISPPLSVTASFGVACVQGDKINWQQLVGFADNAMYHVKANGRNKVQLHSADIHPLKTNDLLI
ncbi:MAG: GGDEF domain-containing protein [Alteromonadaceae bacterium]|nr:GGDEF domain-containing protein [Alteromonadaceae bacterium]